MAMRIESIRCACRVLKIWFTDHRPTRTVFDHWRRRFGGIFVGAALALTSGIGCSAASTSLAFDPSDAVASKGYSFNRGKFLDDSTVTQPFGSLERFQRFLEKTAYLRPSFLETYSSNGVTAAEAIVGASERYRINPVLVLALLQFKQGLISSPTYPVPTSRVEFAFDCGCNSKGTCEPTFAGFDRQVDCIVGAYRRRLDAVTNKGRTPGGWGIGQDGLSLDGVRFAPETNATAAFYDLFPVVGTGDRGASLFWNIFVRYARYLNLSIPMDAAPATP
jgi:hypothetical protein